MRDIHLCAANISGPVSSRTTVDVIDWLQAGFAEAGIALTRDAKLFRGDTPNIIFEGSNELFKPFLDQHRGIKPICFVTEIIDGDQFDVAPGTMDGKERYQSFMSIADHYSGFLTSVESNVPLLRKIAPATFFEFGYSDTLLSISDPAHWRHDFLFTGSLTAYRKKVLQQIADQIPIYVPGGTEAGHTAHALDRESYLTEMGSAAIHIGLKQYAGWKLPSPTKIGRAIMAGSGCVIEKTEVTTRQSALVPTFIEPQELRSRYLPIDHAKIRVEAMQRLADYRANLPLKTEIVRNLSECPALTS